MVTLYKELVLDCDDDDHFESEKFMRGERLSTKQQREVYQ